MKWAGKPLFFTCLAMAVGGLLIAGQVYAVEEHTGASDAGVSEEFSQDSFIEVWDLERLSEETFVKLDINGDNLIQEASEWTGSPELFAVKDVNSDGAISKLERAEMEVDAGAGGN